MLGTSIGQDICTVQEAKMIAKKFYDNYVSNNSINNDSLRKMLYDTLKTMNQSGDPGSQDIEGLQQVLDFNHDGRITIQDIEQLAINSLVGAPTKSNKQIWIQNKLKVAERLFVSFDQDGNNQLNRNEVERLLGETYKQIGADIVIGNADINRSIKMYDKDQNGQVSKQEFIDIVKQSLEQHAKDLGIQ